MKILKDYKYFETENGVLYHGDCLEIMPLLQPESVDLVLTDPPYGTTACSWDSIIPFEAMWLNLKRLKKENAAICLFGSQPFTSFLIMSNIKMFKHEWIWIKNRGSNFANLKYRPMKEHENVLIFGDNVNYYPIKQLRSDSGEARVSSCFQGSNSGKRDAYSNIEDHRKNITYDKLRSPKSYQKFNIEVGFHPTQKPLALIEYLIKTYTNKGDTVLDFTIGSGTTAVACEKIGRK